MYTVKALIFFMSRLQKQFAMLGQAHRSMLIGQKKSKLTISVVEKRIRNKFVKSVAEMRRFCLLYQKRWTCERCCGMCLCCKRRCNAMTTLEDLYYGNISPHERYIKRGTRVDKLVKLICKNEEELSSGLTEKQKETFEKFKDCTSELSCITEREAFSSGFILATRIMAEVMQGLEEVEDI